MNDSPQNPMQRTSAAVHAEENLPHNAEAFGSVPQASEGFRTVQKDSAGFRTVPNRTEKREYCTLTVREAARLFEDAGVARTERSIINWCQPNRIGIPRLDNYFDLNERKYFISPQSVELVIQEEKAKAERVPHDSESNENSSEATKSGDDHPDELRESSIRTEELQKQVIDLRILNAGKDLVIEQMRKERDEFFDKLLSASHRIGELEGILQLEAPDNSNKTSRKLLVRREKFDEAQ